MIVDITHLDEKSQKRVLKFISDLSDDGKENRSKKNFDNVDSIVKVDSIEEANILRKYLIGNVKFEVPDGRLF